MLSHFVTLPTPWPFWRETCVIDQLIKYGTVVCDEAHLFYCVDKLSHRSQRLQSQTHNWFSEDWVSPSEFSSYRLQSQRFSPPDLFDDTLAGIGYRHFAIRLSTCASFEKVYLWNQRDFLFPASGQWVRNKLQVGADKMLQENSYRATRLPVIELLPSDSACRVLNICDSSHNVSHAVDELVWVKAAAEIGSRGNCTWYLIYMGTRYWHMPQDVANKCKQWGAEHSLFNFFAV